MRKHDLFSIFFALLLIIIPSYAFADFDKLYIDGKQYHCFLLIDFDEAYIVEQDVENVFGRSDIKFDPRTNTVTVGDRVLPVKVTFFERTPCLPIMAICKELCLPARWDHYNGKIEISQTPKLVVNNDMNKNDEENNPKRQRIRKKRGLSISLISDEQLKDLSERVKAVRVQALVKNTYLREINRAVAKCIFTYPDGTVLREDEIMIYGIKPDETRRIIFYTENPSMTQIPEYKFEIQEIRTK